VQTTGNHSASQLNHGFRPALTTSLEAQSILRILSSGMSLQLLAFDIDLLGPCHRQ